MQLSEDSIEYEIGLSLEEKRNQLIDQPIVNFEEKYLVDKLAANLERKRKIAEKLQELVQQNAAQISSLARKLLAPITFDTHMSDEYSHEVINYLKSHSDVYFIKNQTN